MLIKHQELHFPIPKRLPALFVLLGQEVFLINRIFDDLKLAWRQANNNDCDEKIVDIDNASQWSLLIDEANTYSLFSQAMLLDVRYDKKTIDSSGKAFFETYLQDSNPRCLVILRTPNLNAKQLQMLVNHDQAIIIQSKYPDKQKVIQWIGQQLRNLSFNFEQEIPSLIEQYTRGNLLACSQAVEKIALIADSGDNLSIDLIKQQLIDQSEYQLFELSDACLLGDSNQALLILRHAIQNRIEPTLILWVLTQEIRYLLQLITLSKQNINFQTALSKLKIWPQRGKLYQAAIKKHSEQGLGLLLNCCNKLDSTIKTEQSAQLWHTFELLALALSSGKRMACLE